MLMKRNGHEMQSLNTRSVPTVDPSERIYAIGDIHGRYDLMLALFQKISDDIQRFSDDRKSRVVFMGDYVDRGDNSRHVVEALVDLHRKRDNILQTARVRLDFLLGNHEAALLDFLKDPEGGQEWLHWGGLQTLASYGVSPKGIVHSAEELHRMRDQLAANAAQHIAFLEDLSPMIVSGGVVFVHAGLDPDSPLHRQPVDATLWGRTKSGKPLGLQGYRVVHGHFDNTTPVSLPDRICVDTGAYYSGRLTAVRLDEGETFLHVDA